ncbi:hypothetical protein LXL04_008680 [Taraxacum kok-saghyz]
MSNLIQETDQELKKHSCKLCDKSFPSGRSLGGHMRSHVISSPDHHHQQQKQMKKLSSVGNGGKSTKNDTVVIDGISNDQCYELRKDPKKTPKVKDSSEIENNNSCLVVLDKLCKECGKGFQSWKALFGHMKCHSEKVANNNNLNQDSWTGQSDNENSRPIKKSKSRNGKIKRYKVTSVTTTTITTTSSSISMNANNNNNNNNNNNQISSNPASTSVVSEIEQDQESEIAMCLMMLSRDEGKWGNEFESSDYCNSSAFVGLTKVEGKKRIGNGFKIKKLEETQVGIDYLGRSEVGFTGIMIQDQELNDESELIFGSKRKFECITCNKSFDSYQALGGHNASHKKLKASLDPKTEGENTIENKPLLHNGHIINGFNGKSSDHHQKAKTFDLGAGSLKKSVALGAHECPICLKIFSSGQALGGHKRSHMVTEARLNQQTSMNVSEKENEPVRGFFDLNMLPDTMEEEIIINSSSTGYQPWHHESTTLLGLLSTI